MFLNPSILALLMVSLVVSMLMLLAVGFAMAVLRRWDINSGSELQLKLERRTYLISTLMVFCFVAELISLLLFVYNAEKLSGRFVGAMCATGVLNANPWGWPALFLKIGVFFAGAAWLVLNRVDNQAPDYPLIRIKYGALLLIFPLVVAEALVQANFFLGLNPDVITSCCGSLFSPQGQGVAAEVAGVEPALALKALAGAAMLGLVTGGWALYRGRDGWPFALSQLVAFVIALVAIVSLIALYIYEHPHHHCPFCILKSGHGYIGYLLYLPLFISTAFALGVLAISPFAGLDSLREHIRIHNRRLIQWALGLMLGFYLLSAWSIYSSSLSMQGVWW